MKISFLITLITATILVSSCYYDKEQLLYPDTVGGRCDDTTGTASYTRKIVPILQQYCYSCHTGGFPSGNIQMGNYSADKVIAQNGKLYGSINHMSGFSPMPQSGGKLMSCQIAVIKKWIDEGMLDN